MKPAKKIDHVGYLPDSWACIDCGVNTAPGVANNARMQQIFAIAKLTDTDPLRALFAELTVFTEHTETYEVKDKVWKAAGMGSGCLCIGCLEKRLGRILTPKDFTRDAVNRMPGTERLLAPRDGEAMSEVEGRGHKARA
jgi:hypothetical protein